MRKADNLPPSCAVVIESGNINILKPSGPLEPVMGLFYILYQRSSRIVVHNSDKRNN